MRYLVAGGALLATATALYAARTDTWPTDILVATADDGRIAVYDKADATSVFSMFLPADIRVDVHVATIHFQGHVGNDILVGGTTRFEVLDVGGNVHLSFEPFGSSYTGGVRVAVGDVNGDGFDDIIVGAGPGAGPHVKVFDGLDLKVHYDFDAYDPGFRGGVFVAAGDIDGDGKADIVTGPGAGAGASAGGGPHVKVFNGATGQLHASFFAYDTGFLGGVRVATGDIDGDGRTDIITGAGPGAPGGHVKVFNGVSLEQHASFFPFEQSYTGGVFVAGDLQSIAVTSEQRSGAFAAVRIFHADAQSQWLEPFKAYDGGLRVAQSWADWGKTPARPRIPGGYKLDATW